jgi:hypothetical protein
VTARGQRRRTYLLLAAAPVAAVLAGCASTVLAGGNTLRSEQPSITGRIFLEHGRVQLGGTVSGKLIFDNRTLKTKVLLSGCAVNGLYAIGLRGSDGYIQAPAFSLVGCSPQQVLVAKPGFTIYRFRLHAMYTACSQSATDQPPKSSRFWIPVCLKSSGGARGVMPPLPIGRYTALFFPNGRWEGPRVVSATLVVASRS